MEIKDNLYKVLGLDMNANSEDIKRAYRTLVLKYHPDRNLNDKQASNKFIEIKNAYDTLSNQIKKAEYDSELNFRQNVQPNMHDFRFNDLNNKSWSEIFNSTYYNRKGENVEVQITITLNEAYFGCAKDIKIGYNKKISVKIERGIRSGMKLRLNGLGQNGNTKENNGDLIITVNVMENPNYFIDNHGLHIVKQLDAIDAILGTKVNVSVFDNDISYVIPPGTSNGKILRLKGKGFPIYNKPDECTDLLINVIINIPDDLDDESIDMLKQIRNRRNEKT